jgi:CheY-like chemotaxis protein
MYVDSLKKAYAVSLPVPLGNLPHKLAFPCYDYMPTRFSDYYSESMPSKRILLVHGQRILRESLKTCLTYLGGWDVVAVSSPEQGLLYACHGKIDVVIFDISACGMNFFAFLKELRSELHNQQVPVVLTGEDVEYFDLDCFKNLGVAGILKVSGDPMALPNKIATMLGWPKPACVCLPNPQLNNDTH